MKQNSRSFKAVDLLLILMMILPLVAGIVLKILTNEPSEGISISGARVWFTLNTPIQSLPITEAQTNSVFVMISILGLCLYLTHGINSGQLTARHHMAEWIVEKVQSLVDVNMGPYFSGFAPFIVAILALSAFSSLSSLLGLFPPTSDFNVVAGWAILVFGLITYYKLKGGLLGYLKGFTEPIFVMTPLNILGEIATPVSMAFRHYGNVLSGVVISVLVATALQGLSSLVLGWLPGFLGEIPFLQVGIPAILSIYFDIFSGCMQAYIFAMLTMLNIAGAFPQEEYELRKQKKLAKAENN